MLLAPATPEGFHSTHTEKGQCANELNVAGDSPQPMTNGAWRINKPVFSLLVWDNSGVFNAVSQRSQAGLSSNFL